MTVDLDLTKRDSFRIFEAEKIRFSDTDMVGHVNNVAFAAILESGRTSFGRTQLRGYLPENVLLVMARVEIDYRRELHWPASVDVGTRVVHIGRSSYVLAQGVFLDDSCVATGRTTIVAIDRQTRRSTPFTDEFRAVLGECLAA